MLRIYPSSRIVERSGPPPRLMPRLSARLLSCVRRLYPKDPPDPSRMWLLVLDKGLHFTAEPLFTGPVETEHFEIFGDLESSTYVSGKAYDGRVIYQNLHTKVSWRRHGIIRAMLLRLHPHLAHEGDPVIEGEFTHSGWGVARHMQQCHSWGILGSAPKDLPPPS